MGLWSWINKKIDNPAIPKTNELLMIAERAQQTRLAKHEISPKLKPFITRLRQVHAEVGSFAAPETPIIGRQILDELGHHGMLVAHDVIRSQLGASAARDLEYKWNGIGNWLG